MVTYLLLLTSCITCSLGQGGRGSDHRARCSTSDAFYYPSPVCTFDPSFTGLLAQVPLTIGTDYLVLRLLIGGPGVNYSARLIAVKQSHSRGGIIYQRSVHPIIAPV